MAKIDEQYIIDICKNAKKASKILMNLNIKEKNIILNKVADAILENAELILEQNLIDIENATNDNVKASFVERLTLDLNKIEYMSNTLKQVATLDDVVNQYDYMKTLENGLLVGKKRVPLGVVCLIFESRPNMVVDSFALCIKTGNVVVLRGGKEAILTNKAIELIIQNKLIELGYEPLFLQLIHKVERDLVGILVKQNKYLDVVIPRGSASLINAVIAQSTVPVIETGIGNCHVYVDKYADLNKAIDIIYNAKTHRVSVCNACETVLINKDIAEKFLPLMEEKLLTKNVKFRCCHKSINYIKSGVLANENDWSEEYLDYILAVKIVDNIDDAVSHIDNYGTKHSEVIVTDNYTNSQKFLREIDASTVYVNASSRFTDGDQFGFGGEIGISTQKLHARGPMGLEALTTYKYIVYGEGQVRQ